MSSTALVSWAFALAALFISCLTFKAHRLWAIGCVIGFLLFTAVGVHFQKQEQYEEYGNDAKYAGILTPGAASTVVPESCKPLPADSFAIISLGKRSGVLLKGPNLETMVFIHHHSYVSVKTQNGSLLLTARVFDGNGKRLISMTDNFYVVDGNRVLRDLAPSDNHSLSVFDLENRLIFHVDFRNPQNAYITGRFSDSDALPLTIMDDVIRMDQGDVGGTCVAGGRVGIVF